MKNRITSLLLLLLMLSLPVMGEEEVSLFSPGGTAPAQAETLHAPEPSAVPEPGAELDLMPAAAVEADPAASSEARDELIDRMIDLAEEIYQKANGRAQPANSRFHLVILQAAKAHHQGRRQLGIQAKIMKPLQRNLLHGCLFDQFFF